MRRAGAGCGDAMRRRASVGIGSNPSRVDRLAKIPFWMCELFWGTCFFSSTHFIHRWKNTTGLLEKYWFTSTIGSGALDGCCLFVRTVKEPSIYSLRVTGGSSYTLWSTKALSSTIISFEPGIVVVAFSLPSLTLVVPTCTTFTRLQGKAKKAVVVVVPGWPL